MSEWRSRIVGRAEVDPSQITANALNWRVHPTHQRHALLDVLNQVGWVQPVIINRTTGNLVDGHLRVDLAVERGEATVPVEYVELSEQEEALILASLDPLAGLAVADAEQFAILMDTIGEDVDGDVLRGMLDDLGQSILPVPDDGNLPPSEPHDFWPKVQFTLPPNTYSEWREMFEEMPGEADHEKVETMLKLIEEGQRLR